MKTFQLQQFINQRQQPLSLDPNHADVVEELCQSSPTFALKGLNDGSTHRSQKAVLLAGLLRANVDPDSIARKLRSLPERELLHVVDGLRRRRLNGRRVRELVLGVLLGHERLVELAATHRLRLRRTFKHFLGEKTWSSVQRFLAEPSTSGDRFLERTVLRFAADVDKAKEALAFLGCQSVGQPEPVRQPWLVMPWFKKSPKVDRKPQHPILQQRLAAQKSLSDGAGLPRDTLFGIRGTYHPQVPKPIVRRLSAMDARGERADGVLTALFKESLAADRGSRSFREIMDRSVVGQGLPSLDVSAAVVLDLSASAISSGERRYHPAALGLAIVGLLERCLSSLSIFQTGGTCPLDSQTIPQPVGPTDLASAVLQAARSGAQTILIISDGYENARQGDVAQVVEGLRRLEVVTTVYQIVPTFAETEDLSRRRLGDNIPLLRFDHEHAVGDLAARLLLAEQPEVLSPATLATLEQLLFGGES